MFLLLFERKGSKQYLFKPESLEEMEYRVIFDCAALKLFIPKNVTKIGAIALGYWHYAMPFHVT